MKIEPRKIKKTLKYAAACTCVAIAFTGCNDVALSGDVPYTPSPSPESSQPYKTDEIVKSTPEATPEIAGGIPVLNTGAEVELSGDVAYK